MARPLCAGRRVDVDARARGAAAVARHVVLGHIIAFFVLGLSPIVARIVGGFRFPQLCDMQVK